jgi:uncharacterized SAM-binding protein YcdF (DUF218 family)
MKITADNNKPDILIVLGAPNNSRGELSTTAVERAEIAIREYKRRLGCKILLTGGYGKHFNTTQKPHAYYVSKFLISHGVASTDLLEYVESSNTIEDAILSNQILDALDVETLCVITSDFHMERARLIFNHFFQNYDLEFIEAPSRLSPEELKHILLHEKKALRRLKDKQSLLQYVTKDRRIYEKNKRQQQSHYDEK